MGTKLSKRICSAILAVAMLMSLAPVTTFAITDEDIPASVELGKGFNLLDCKTFESANLKSAILFDSVEGLNPTKVRLSDVESKMTYITSMSSYLDNTHTDISTEVGVTKEGLIAKAEIKAKFGFKGEWESSGKVNTSRLILEIIAKAYKYSLNMEMNDPWAKNEADEYVSLNPTFARDLVKMRPEDLFETYGTHIVTQYDAGGEAYTAYEGTDTSNSMKSEFDITTNATVNVSAADIADVNVEVNASGGEKHEESFANNNKQTSTRVRGGDPFYSSFDKIISGDADDTVNAWLQSMYAMDDNTGSTKATMIKTDDLMLMPIWELLEMDYGTDHSKRVEQLRDYFQENANREYLELYEEFIYGIPGDYADNYNVIQKAFVTDEELDEVDSAPSDRIPIYTEKDLNLIGESKDYPLDGNYVLMRDIEMKYSFNGIGYTSNGIEPFTGDFDGNGHTIYYLNPVRQYNDQNEVYMGFVLHNKGNIYDLRFVDANPKASASTLKSGATKTSKAFLGLVVGKNEAPLNSCNLYNIYIDNANLIIRNAPAITLVGLLAGELGEGNFVENITVVNSNIDVSAPNADGMHYIGGVCGLAETGGGMISHDNTIYCNNNAYVGGCLGYFASDEDERFNTFSYDNDVTSSDSSNRQLSGYGDLNAYTIGGSDLYALANEKVFKYYCDNEDLLGGLGGYAEAWKVHSDTQSKPWLIVHAPDGVDVYQNSLINMKNLKVYFAMYGDDTASFEDVTDRVNFIYNFSEVKDDVPVTVVYGKHIIEFTVDVLEPVAKDMAITNKGKTQYRVGEKFDNSTFAAQILYSNNLTGSVNASDNGLKVYIPELAGDEPIDVGEYKFAETSTGTDVVVEYMGCTAEYQISVLPEDLTDKLHFSALGTESAPGGEFEISISLNNNPGIIALSAYMEYDNDIFEVVGVDDAQLLDSFQNVSIYKPTVPLLWMNTDKDAENNVNEGTLATVRFRVKEGSYDKEDYGMHLFKVVNGEAYNNKAESILIPDLAIKVRLNEVEVGDVNSDSLINSYDAYLLAQHTYNIPNKINLSAADINRDEIVNHLDSTNLNRHMVGFFGLDDAPGRYNVRVNNGYFDDTFLMGIVVNSPLPQPEEKLGYIFEGYYSDATYKKKITKLPAKSVKEMVIYSKYIPGYVIESDYELENNIHVYEYETPLVCEGVTSWNVYDGETLVYENVSSIPASYKPQKGLRVEKYVEDYTGKTFTITYEENGVECTYASENPRTYTYGVDTVLINPEVVGTSTDKTAIQFAGWYDNAEFEGLPVTNLNGKSGNITLYAKWNRWTCRVSLDPRGGILDETVLTHTYGTETVLPIPTNPNPAYKFSRWVHDNNTITSIPADVYHANNKYSYEIYAEWSYEPTITLTLRGSATYPFSTDIETRKNVNAFTKYSIGDYATDYETEELRVYKFLGWYKTGTDLFVTKQYLENVEVDLDLTAKWEDVTQTFVVNFYDHDNTLLQSDEHLYRDSIQFVKVPEYNGTCENEELVFTGWKIKNGRSLGDTDYIDVSSIHTSGARVVDVVAYLRDRAMSVLVTYRHDESYYDFGRTEMSQIYNYLADRPTYPYISSGTQNTIPAELKSFEKEFWFSTYNEPFMIMNVKKAICGTGTMEVNGISYCMYYSNGDELYTRDYVEWESDTVTSNTYNILCDVNPGPGSLLDIMTYTNGGETVTLPTDVTKEGYTFAGWYNNREYTGSPITQVTGDNKGDKIFYAKWVKATN